MVDSAVLTVKGLKDSLVKLVSVLEKAGIDSSRMQIEFKCFDRSEGIDVICSRVDSIGFDLVKNDKVNIELS